jgi:uncharacterized protein YfdQ (DUF2303 family)
MLTMPADAKIAEIPKEKLETPRFLCAAPMFNEVGAFIAYVNSFKDDATRIFYHDSGVFEAIFDYHRTADDPRHGDHRASLALQHAPEWKIWTANNGKQMGQREFAEFIEDNAADLLQPSPADMLEVATGLQTTCGATFRRAINQANGTVQVQFDENIEAKVAGGNKDVPATFVVALRPFMGCNRYQVECRLRYRASGGNLTFHYKALRLDPILEGVLSGETGITAKIRDETGITPAYGAACADHFKKGI